MRRHEVGRADSYGRSHDDNQQPTASPPLAGSGAGRAPQRTTQYIPYVTFGTLHKTLASQAKSFRLKREKHETITRQRET
jgi:hypothetical protein